MGTVVRNEVIVISRDTCYEKSLIFFFLNLMKNYQRFSSKRRTQPDFYFTKITE